MYSFTVTTTSSYGNLGGAGSLSRRMHQIQPGWTLLKTLACALFHTHTHTHARNENVQVITEV